MEKFKYYAKKAFSLFNCMEMRILPGNVAFFFVLALFPIITIVVGIASYFSISLDIVVDFIHDLLPQEAGNIIIEAISGKGFDSSVGAFSLIALFAASNGTYAIINAANTLYQVEESDSLKNRIKSVLLLFILLLLIVFLLLVPMFGEKIISLLGDSVLLEQIRFFYKLLRWPLTFFLIYVNLKLLYTIAPDKKISSKSTTYGSIFTTIIWTLATAIFGYYLKYFANYNLIYGNLSSIIILMMWIYIISYVFVMGIAINATNFNES